MPQKRELINLTITNNSDCTLSIPLFQNNVASINATTKYSWLINVDYSCGYGSIVINGSTYSLTFDGTLIGLLAALNALGFGLFCSETVAGDLYIYTVDDTNIYGDLELCPSVTTTSTTTTTTAPVTTSTTTTTTTLPVTTSTTTTTTTAPVTTSTSTTTTTAPTTTTSTTTTTTTAAVTTTSTTTTTTLPITTTTSTTTTTTTAATTTTTSTTTTTTTLAFGECYSVQNTQGADIGVQFYNINNVLTCNICPQDSTITLCVYAGTGSSIYPWTNTDCTGSLASAVITSLVTNCLEVGDCFGTTTTTTLSPP